MRADFYSRTATYIYGALEAIDLADNFLLSNLAFHMHAFGSETTRMRNSFFFQPSYASCDWYISMSKIRHAKVTNIMCLVSRYSDPFGLQNTFTIPFKPV